LSLGGRSRSGAQVTSWISSENHRSHSSLQAHRANPLDHAQDGQGAGSPRQHCGANLAGARTQTSPAKELQTVTGPEVRRKASGKDRKVSSAAGGNLSRMHKTQETAKESRLNFMYSHLRNRTLVTVVAVVPISADAIQLVYKTPDGILKDRLLGRHEEKNIAPATRERPWSFEGDGDAFKLAVEAKRIDLAFLFDPMMAVHTSNVEPLPHQITAVYESMLPRQPLRFVLADDPGAGKTIMAGLYIRELIMRADARRIVIVTPGSLVEQWREEMFEKFGLEFRVFTKDLEAATPSGNPFEDIDHLIVRLDQMARNEDLQEKLCAAGWDLAVFDEAHKLAAHYFGSKLEKTGRFRFAEKVGAHVRHLLLMTATPHSGKEEDYQLFLSLLDADRFYGKFRDGVHKVDASDLMRRMVKEELVR